MAEKLLLGSRSDIEALIHYLDTQRRETRVWGRVDNQHCVTQERHEILSEMLKYDLKKVWFLQTQCSFLKCLSSKTEPQPVRIAERNKQHQWKDSCWKGTRFCAFATAGLLSATPTTAGDERKTNGTEEILRHASEALLTDNYQETCNRKMTHACNFPQQYVPHLWPLALPFNSPFCSFLFWFQPATSSSPLHLPASSYLLLMNNIPWEFSKSSEIEMHPAPDDWKWAHLPPSAFSIA